MLGYVRRSRVWLVTLAGCLLALTGCTLSSNNVEPSSIVHDNAIKLDLTRKPTREDLGFQPGRNDRSYQRSTGVDTLTTTVILPTGTLQVPAFGVSADSGDLTTKNDLPPKHITVQRTFANAAQALQSLTEEAPLLGISQQDTQSLLQRIKASAKTPTPQDGVLNGLIHDWLSIEINVIGDDDGSVGVNYDFGIDQFHNPVVDKLVHNGVFNLDLTRRPSRDQLGFLDGYDIGRVQPAWNEKMSIRLTLPDGVIQRPINSVTSTSNQTQVSLTTGSIQDIHQSLIADATILGIQPSAVDAVFAGKPGHVKTTLSGRHTSVCDITVIIDATLGESGEFAAGATYEFTYH